MQSTASNILQTSFLITGGDSSLDGLKILERKPDPKDRIVTLFSTQQTHPENSLAKTGPLDTFQWHSGIAHISVVIQSQTSQKKTTLWY